MEGAMPWDVDKPLYDFGMPMGPFAMGDLAGLDIGWSKETSKSSTVREVLCEMDRRGQKTGAGFYDYDEQRNAKPSPVTEKIIKDFAAKAGVTPRQISEQEILERCIYPMINEGAKILEEKIAIRPPTSTSSGSTATAGRCIAAARCSMPTPSAWPRGREAQGIRSEAGRRLQHLAAAGKARGRRQAVSRFDQTCNVKLKYSLT